MNRLLLFAGILGLLVHSWLIWPVSDGTIIRTLGIDENGKLKEVEI